jgi:hypothetical protein
MGFSVSRHSSPQTNDRIGPLDDLSWDEYRAIGKARTAAFETLLESP